MSITVMSVVWQYYPGKNGELLLALKLADAANDDGSAIFKKVDTLARLTRMSVRAVQALLRRMEETGFLVVTKHAQGGRGHARQYSVNPRWLANPVSPLDGSLKSDCHEPVPEIKGAESAPFNNEKGCSFQQERVHAAAPFTEPSYIRNSSLYVLNPLPLSDESPGFALWWQSWPASPNKTRKAECRRRWQRMGLERERELVQAHMHRAVIGSEAALREAGKFLLSPKRYLDEAEWREPATAGVAGVAATASCCQCAEPGTFRIGHRLFCQAHYRERDD